MKYVFGMPSYADPSVILSRLTDRTPGVEITWRANWPAKWKSPPSAGGNGPLNRPVAASIVGTFVIRLSAGAPRPATTKLLVSVAVLLKLDAGVAGVTDLVLRG